MRVILPLILAFMPTLLISCDYVRATSRPCREDKFFCNEPLEQKALLTSISDSRLLRVSRINYRRFHPPSGDFAREIARRGSAGIAILQRLNAEDEIDVEIFRDTARAYRADYNIDVCHSNRAMVSICNSMISHYN